MTQWVPPPWPLLLWAKERTTAILSALRANSGKTPPNWTPGRQVVHRDRRCCGTRPGRRRLGVEGFDVGRAAAEPEPDDGGVARGLALCGGAARAPQQVGQHEAAEAERPTLRKSRRLAPSQVVPLRDPVRWNMNRSLQMARASFPRRAEKEGVAGRKRRAPPEGTTLTPRLSGFGARQFKSGKNGGK